MLKYNFGVPPGYDMQVPGAENKRTIIERRECGNCREEFEAGYGEFIPPEEMAHFPHHWCSAECFLSYARNSMIPRQYTLLEAAVRTLENRPVEARPSRFLLQKNGGHISIEEYLQGTVRPMIEGGTKRVMMKFEVDTADQEYSIPILDTVVIDDPDEDYMEF
jgi:hypothetical protein